LSSNYINNISIHNKSIAALIADFATVFLTSLHLIHLYNIISYTQLFYGPLGFCPGQPGRAITRKVKHTTRKVHQSGFTGARDSEWQRHQLGHMQKHLIRNWKHVYGSSAIIAEHWSYQDDILSQQYVVLFWKQTGAETYVLWQQRLGYTIYISKHHYKRADMPEKDVRTCVLSQKGLIVRTCRSHFCLGHS